MYATPASRRHACITMALASAGVSLPTGVHALAARARRPLAALALAGCLLPWTAHPAQIQWISPGGGFWDDAANWSGGLPPGPEDDVVIGQLDSGNIEVSQLPGTPGFPLTRYFVYDLRVEAPFTHAGGSLHVTGNATFLDTFTWSGGYAHILDSVTSGTWTFARGILVTSPTPVGASRGLWRLEGLSSVEAGAGGFLFNPQAAVEIASGGRLDVTGTAQLTFNGGLTIAGTLDHVAGDGTIAFNARGGANNGLVRNRVGILEYTQTGGPAHGHVPGRPGRAHQLHRRAAVHGVVPRIGRRGLRWQ